MLWSSSAAKRERVVEREIEGEIPMLGAKSAKSVLVVLVCAVVLILGQATQAVLIAGVSATASSAIYSENNVVNGNGLSGIMHGNPSSTVRWLNRCF